MGDEVTFESRNRKMVGRMAGDEVLKELTHAWFERVSAHEYSYHFKWMGRPVIQFPQDLVAIQEIIWEVKPELIIETGVARGGSIAFLASMLELVGGEGHVVGVDIDLREHNREALGRHPMSRRMTLLEGSSTSELVIDQVHKLASERRPTLVILDSNHTHDHVLTELDLYSPLVGAGSYLIVMDTIIEEMPPSFSSTRPWGPGDNPATAVAEFLNKSDRFVVDRSIETRLQITVAPGGYLRCIRD